MCRGHLEKKKTSGLNGSRLYDLRNCKRSYILLLRAYLRDRVGPGLFIYAFQH